MKILCIGGSAWDITLPINKYPIENKKYRINKKYECGGGSANNAAYLLALWHDDVYLASSIGNDIYADKIKEEMIKRGVKIDFFQEHSYPTTTSYIINNLENGSRTIITNKHSEMKFSKDFNITLKPDVIFVDGNDFEMSLKIFKENPDAIKIIDAGSVKEGSKELCEMCNYVVCSNDFARDYTGINFKCNDFDSVALAYEKLHEEFNGQIIITLEEYGSFTKIDNEYKLVPSIKVNSIDTTGAGDIYHGAFTHFIARNYNLLDTMKFANIAGALSVEKIGSKNSMPTIDEVMNYHEL